MGRPRKWKPGDKGFISAGTKDLFGLMFDHAQEVTVDSVIAQNRVKVTTADGSCYYCAPKDIKSRKAQAIKSPAEHVIAEDIKDTAEMMAEKRMEKIMETISKTKPTFEEVCEKFYALAKVGQAEKTLEIDIVISLAEKTLYEEIKDGVVWE